MKLYIVKIYPTEEKLESDALVCGIYRTENQLAKCVFEHYNAFHFEDIWHADAYDCALKGKIYTLNRYAKTAQIEVVVTNTWNAHGVI